MVCGLHCECGKERGTKRTHRHQRLEADVCGETAAGKRLSVTKCKLHTILYHLVTSCQEKFWFHFGNVAQSAALIGY